MIRFLLFICVLNILFSCQSAGKDIENESINPNIILIMADDMGWGDAGYNGHERIRTPNLDKMAQSGAQFNRFYAAAPVCSPTRGSVLTGRNPYRYGITSANVSHLRDEEINLAELLSSEGYLTGHFGKWHLGTLFPDFSAKKNRNPAENHMTPGMAGFDEWCVTESSIPTFNPYVKTKANAYGDGHHYNYDRRQLYIENGIILENDLHGCDSKIIMDKAIPFIEEAVKENKPFFTVIWFHAPHGPIEGHPEYMKSLYSDLPDEKQHYYSVITALDAQIGVLRIKLRELGVEDNTMLCFTSDNGPEGNPGPNQRYQGSTGKFRGRKRSLYEGGIRVPGIIEWPGVITEHREIDTPVVTSDYFPTICDILGYNFKDKRPIDGISLMDIIKGNQASRGSDIGFQFINHRQKALIGDRYKLVYNLGEKRSVSDNSDLPRKVYELYDILEDPYETINLSEVHPEILEEMKIELRDFVESCVRSNQGEDYTNKLPIAQLGEYGQ